MKLPTHSTNCNTAERPGERGSALLIVFVFAAAVAIMLYMEMPVAVFEAQREKEQLLVDRGNEYAHSVKLFVRKIGNYPPSLEALENTNRMRFLRHRFKDPMTGKEDWRLLHAGPGGVLIDSKVKRAQTVLQGTTATAAGNTGAFSSGGFSSSPSTSASSSNPASLSSFATSSSSSSSSEVPVAPIPQRPPAISASGGGVPGAGSETGPNPGNLGSVMRMDQTDPATNQQQPNPDGSLPNPVNPGLPGSQQQAANGAPGSGAPAGAAVQTDGAAAMQAVRGLATNPNAPVGGATQNGAPVGGATQNGAGQTNASRTGQIMSGGLAGVASLAKGHSIKAVNEQTDFSLWEFYYDPTKDTLRTNTGMQPGGGLNTGQSGTSATQNSAFGNSSTNSAFGNSSTNSTFGNSSTNSTFGNSSTGNSTSGSTGFFTSPSNSGMMNRGTTTTQGSSQNLSSPQAGTAQQAPPN